MTYGAAVRDQVLEVIVRQAIAGAPWREICAGPMLVNNIRPEEVEAEVFRRLHKGKETLAPTEQQALATYLEGWRDVVQQRKIKPIAEIEDAVASFYSNFDAEKPAVVVCKSPAMMYLHLMLLIGQVGFVEDVERAISILSQQQSETFASNLRESVRELLSKYDVAKSGPADSLIMREPITNLKEQAWIEMRSNLSHDLVTYFEWGFKSEIGAIMRPLDILYSLSLSNATSIIAGQVSDRPNDLESLGAELERLGINPGGTVQTRVDTVVPARALRFNSTSVWQLLDNIAPCFVAEHLNENALSGAVRRKSIALLSLFRAAPMYAFFKGICLVADYPTEVVVDQQLRAHNGEGPAITFSDDYKNFAMFGLNVPRHLIEGRDSLTIDDIDKTENVEIRRFMIELYGSSRFMVDSGAKLIHEDEFGKLYRKELPDDEPIVMLSVINSTMEPDGTYKNYFLRVPPRITTAREAVAWTFSLQSKEYDPNVQS